MVAFLSSVCRSRRGRWVLLILLVLLAALAARIWLVPGDDRDALQTPSSLVEQGDVELLVTALGNLQPRDYVDVGAQASGQLQRFHVAIGDRVKQGDLLAEIDPKVLLARVEASRAQLANLNAQMLERQAQLELAELKFRRQDTLLKQGATSEESHQTARAQWRSAEASIASLKAQIRQLESTLHGDEVTLSYTQIHAPMGGTVVSMTARQGQTLNATQQAPVILRIADLSTMTVWTQVSEADVAKLSLGMEAYFTTLGAPNRRWYGKLQQILPTPEVLNNVVLYTALFDIANPDQQLMTQMSVQVFFVQAAARGILRVPVSALTPLDAREKRYQVTVMDERGRRSVREVVIGTSNRAHAEIVSGLQAGERVLLQGQGIPTGPAGRAGPPGAGRMRLGV